MNDQDRAEFDKTHIKLLSSITTAATRLSRPNPSETDVVIARDDLDGLNPLFNELIRMLRK